MANHNNRKRNEPMRTRRKCQARENASDQVAIGFGFASDWLNRWRELFKPITERSNPDYFPHLIENRCKIWQAFNFRSDYWIREERIFF